eukprot:gene32481-32529_t
MRAPRAAATVAAAVAASLLPRAACAWVVAGPPEQVAAAPFRLTRRGAAADCDVTVMEHFDIGPGVLSEHVLPFVKGRCPGAPCPPADLVVASFYRTVFSLSTEGDELRSAAAMTRDAFALVAAPVVW